MAINKFIYYFIGLLVMQFYSGNAGNLFYKVSGNIRPIDIEKRQDDVLLLASGNTWFTRAEYVGVDSY